jgi:predicted phage baseplate assembly protein
MTDSVARQALPVPLAYRRADRATVLTTLIRDLVKNVATDKRLATRSLLDPTVALLDAWATVADVVDFYQERIAAESYLLTATEPESVLALATLVGYRPRPGLAATCWLAYTLVADPTDTAVLLPRHQLVQSVPGPGELPQTFETGEDLIARPNWNTLPIKTTAPVHLDYDSQNSRYNVPDQLVVSGAVVALKPNDVILLMLSQDTTSRVIFRVKDTQGDIVTNKTSVTLQTPLPPPTLQPDSLPPHEDSLSPTPAVASQPGAAAPAAQQDENEKPPSDPLLDTANKLFGKLTLNASTPPRTATAVPQDPDAVYRGSHEKEQPTLSDTDIKLLTALQPGLANALYPALATSTLGTPEVASVQALRVTTAPFGVQVPPRARFDTQGRLLTPEEWPLNENQVLTIMLTSDPGAEVRSMASAGGSSITVRIDGPGHHAAGTITNGATIDLAGGAGTAQLTNGTLVFSPGDTSGLEKITVTATPGEVTATRNDDSSGAVSAAIDASWSGSSTSPSGLSIDLRIPLRRSNDDPIQHVIEVASALPVSGDDRKILYLNERHDEIIPGSYVMVDDPTATPPYPVGKPVPVNPADPPAGQADSEPFYPRIAEVVSASPVTLNRYGMSLTVTRLQLKAASIRQTARLLSDLRPLTVFAQSVDLDLLQAPTNDTVGRNDAKPTEIPITGLYPGIETGHRLVITGTRADLTADASVQATEAGLVAAVRQESNGGEPPYTVLTLANKLAYRYRPDTVTVYGNVVPAHHGTTITETLTPSGDPAHPTVTLAQFPVLADPSNTQSGYASTLILTVDGRTWTAVSRLDESTPPRCYLTGTDGTGRTTVTLGQPLPHPASTVTATYRAGAGSAGNVRAGQLTQPLTKPLPVASVTNPLPASGGSDPDGPDAVRTNAPRGLRALGRVVSADDAADIALSWAGIGKSTAVLGSDGQRDTLTVTVAGTSPAPLDSSDALINDLGTALAAAGDITVPITVTPAKVALIVMAATIDRDPDISCDTVERAVRAELLDAYGYDHRDIDEDIIVSDLIAVIHRIDGVRSCTITRLGCVDSQTSPADLVKFAPGPSPDTGRLAVTGVAHLSGAVAETLILQEPAP